MPSLQRSVSVAANSAVNLVSGWQYERIPQAFGMAYLRMMLGASGTGCVVSVVTGSSEVVQQSAIGSGTTAGVIPTVYSQPVIDWQSDPDDLLAINVSNTTGSAVTVGMHLSIEPMG